MSDKPFRILLDLTDLHIDGFKYVWINISPRDLKTISDLKTDLFKRLNFEKHEIKLFVRDGLLLDEETIIILREDDTVKVQYEDNSILSQNGTNSSMEGKVQKSFHKRSFIECSADDLSPKAKKHKNSHNSSSLMVTESNQVKHSKKKKNHKKSCDGTQSLYEDTTVVNSCEKNFESSSVEPVSISKRKEIINPSEVCSDVDDLQSSSLEVFGTAPESSKTEVSGENTQKKKRKRHRKRKSASNLAGSYVPDNNMTVQYSIPSFAPDTSVIRKHIVFTSPTPCQNKDVNILTKENVGTSDLHSETTEVLTDLKNSSNSNEESQNVSNEANFYPRISTPSASTGFTKYQQNWVSPMLNKDLSNSPQSIIKKTMGKCNEKKDVSDILKKVPSQVKYSSDAVSQNKYSDLPSINSMPKVGTHIAFKMLEMDENYSPVVSEYKEGVVRMVDHSTEDIEINLLEKEIKPGRTGKFENLRDDEKPDPEIIECVTLKFDDLINLKQVI